MEYGMSDSSGTDDDFPPTRQNRFVSGGRPTNGRSGFANSQLPPVHSDMEDEIHQIEQEAYSSVLRAFKAQSDAITWEMESLITELRKELRVSDEEHRVLLAKVNNDDVIKRIREWRKARGTQPGMLSSSRPVHDPLPSPSLKKQKTSQSMSLGAPTPTLQPSRQPSSSALKQGPVSGARGKNPKPSVSTGGFAGRSQVANQGSANSVGLNEPTDVAHLDPLIGKKVWTRWPEDNSFYEAVITDFNPMDGCHALVYDIGTPDEAWEWVNLKKISPDDIRWKSEDIGVSHRGGHSGSGRGVKKSMARGGGTVSGRGRGSVKGQLKKDFAPPQNGIGKKALPDIRILHTETLIKEVEKVFNSSNADPSEVEKAKEVLKEHEQALVDAIAKLMEASDGESDRQRRNPLPQRKVVDLDGSRKKYNKEKGDGSSDGDRVAKEPTTLSNLQDTIDENQIN